MIESIKKENNSSKNTKIEDINRARKEILKNVNARQEIWNRNR